MTFKLRIWRQPDAKTPGKLVDYGVRDITMPATPQAIWKAIRSGKASHTT